MVTKPLKPGALEKLYSEIYPLKPYKPVKVSEGYLYIKLENHPFANIHGLVPEPRALMEQSIGRFLERNEVVRHRNGKRRDNSLPNLVLHSQYPQLPKEELTAIVLAGAKDPAVFFKDLPCSVHTAKRICAQHGVKWVSREKRPVLTEAMVKAARRGRLTTMSDVARELGVHVASVRAGFRHLWNDTLNPPGFLDSKREEILHMKDVQKIKLRRIAYEFKVSPATLSTALGRWAQGQPHTRGPRAGRALEPHFEEILQMLQAGQSQKEVASRFGTYIQKVRTHLQRWKEEDRLPPAIAARMLARKRSTRKRRKPN